MKEPRILSVIIETREEGNADVVRVLGVFPKDTPLPPVEDGWTRNVVDCFESVVMRAPGFRFHQPSTETRNARGGK